MLGVEEQESLNGMACASCNLPGLSGMDALTPAQAYAQQKALERKAAQQWRKEKQAADRRAMQEIRAERACLRRKNMIWDAAGRQCLSAAPPKGHPIYKELFEERKKQNQQRTCSQRKGMYWDANNNKCVRGEQHDIVIPAGPGVILPYPQPAPTLIDAMPWVIPQPPVWAVPTPAPTPIDAMPWVIPQPPVWAVPTPAPLSGLFGLAADVGADAGGKVGGAAASESWWDWANRNPLTNAGRAVNEYFFPPEPALPFAVTSPGRRGLAPQSDAYYGIGLDAKARAAAQAVRALEVRRANPASVFPDPDADDKLTSREYNEKYFPEAVAKAQQQKRIQQGIDFTTTLTDALVLEPARRRQAEAQAAFAARAMRDGQQPMFDAPDQSSGRGTGTTVGYALLGLAVLGGIYLVSKKR